MKSLSRKTTQSANEQKKKRSDEIAKGERAEKKREEWLAQLEKARIDTNNMKEKLRRLVRYQAFLQSVVDRSLGDNDYDEIIDILNRHKTLVKANVDLQEQQTLAERTVDNVRTKNAQELTSTQNKILVENSKIHEKQTEIENLKQSNTNMENTIEENAKRSASAKKDAGQVVMSIKNLSIDAGLLQRS